jgi:hypothetical protein
MQIFISYSRPDEAAARRLHSELKGKGLKPWLDKEMLLPGQRWRNEIAKAIKGSDFAAVLFSNASVVRDGFYHREIRTCLDVLQDKASGKVWLLPIRLDECSVPSEVEEYQYVDLFPDWNEGMGRLLRSITEQVGIKSEVADQIDSIIIDSEKSAERGKQKDFHIVLIDTIRAAGGVYVRHGSGSHQLWQIPTPQGQRLIVVPHKTASRAVVNRILREGGLPPMS